MEMPAEHNPVSSHAGENNSMLLQNWLAVIALFAAFCLTVPLAPSADTWWHLATGRYIAQSKIIPHVDPFSATAAGKPWTAHEWLSDVIFYVAYSATGSMGLLFLACALTTLAFWFAYRSLGGAPLSRALALTIGVWAARPDFSVRPQLFSFLMAGIFLFVLRRYVTGGSTRILFAMPILMLLWVNLHGGYALGLALIFLFILGIFLDALWGREDRSTATRTVKELLLALLGCLAVVPLNPNGFALYTYPFETLHSAAMQAGIMEWRSPDFHSPMFYPLAALLFLIVAVLALSPTRPKPAEILLFVFFGLAALRSMRNLPFFALIAFPLLGRYLVFPSLSRPLIPERLHRILKLAAIVLAAAISAQFVSSRFAQTLQMEKARFPLRASAFLDQQNLPAPILNSYDFGGYLIWKLYPRYHVYIDGRADLYGDQFLNNFIQLYEVNEDPRPTLDRDGIRTIIVEPGSTLAGYLRTQKDWNHAYEDPVAVIFTR
jgi:hypothetical protein